MAIFGGGCDNRGASASFRNRHRQSRAGSSRKNDEDSSCAPRRRSTKVLCTRRCALVCVVAPHANCPREARVVRDTNLIVASSESALPIGTTWVVNLWMRYLERKDLGWYFTETTFLRNLVKVGPNIIFSEFSGCYVTIHFEPF